MNIEEKVMDWSNFDFTEIFFFPFLNNCVVCVL